jgi:hypothetical protein
MTRQQRYQQDHKARGLCEACSEPVVPNTTLCIKHLAKRRDRQRAAGAFKAWRPGGPGRPPKAR